MSEEVFEKRVVTSINTTYPNGMKHGFVLQQMDGSEQALIGGKKVSMDEYRAFALMSYAEKAKNGYYITKKTIYVQEETTFDKNGKKIEVVSRDVTVSVNDGQSRIVESSDPETAKNNNAKYVPIPSANAIVINDVVVGTNDTNDTNDEQTDETTDEVTEEPTAAVITTDTGQEITVTSDGKPVDETDETGSTVGEITGEALSNLAKEQDDSSDEETDTTPNGKNKPITEAEVKKIFKDEFERYYRRSYPTFEVTGGGPTDRHEQSEYCVTTQSAQGIHFYEGGIAKIKANKNFELYSGYDASIGDGEVTGEGGNAFKIECKHGRILITSKASDIELNGRNIMIKAQKNIYLEAEINTRIRSGNDTNILTGNDMNIVADKELFVGGGGAVGIHCESDFIETTSGVDLDVAPDFFDELSGFYDQVPISKIDQFFSPNAGLD